MMLVHTTINQLPDDAVFIWGWKNKRQRKTTLEYYHSDCYYCIDYKVTWIVPDKGPRTKAYRERD